MASETIDKFTDNKIKGYKPKSERYTVTCNSLELRVSPNGRKSFRFMFRFEGENKQLTIGQYPLVSLAEINESVAAARKLLAQGINPIVFKENIKQANAAMITVEQLVDKFIANGCKKVKPDTAKQYESELKAHVVKAWGKRTVESITRPNAIKLLSDMEDLGLTATTRRIRTYLTKMFDFAFDTGIITTMPLYKLPVITANTKERFLTDAEIYYFWHGVNKIRSARTRAALRLMLLLGRRGIEVVSATWDQFDLDKKIWLMTPAKIHLKYRAKFKPVIMPLPPLALKILEERRASQSMWNFVFPSEYDPMTHQTVHSLNSTVRKRWKDMGFKEQWTPHDLRRTLSTQLAALDYEQAQINRILAHKLQGVEGTYNRHEYVEQRMKALTEWDAMIAKIIAGPPPQLN